MGSLSAWGIDKKNSSLKVKSPQNKMMIIFINGLVSLIYFFSPDRTTVIGQMISSYLQQESELEDHVVHLLFTANRWEAV